MSTIVAVAEAVVAALNAGAFSLPFIAQREYLPAFDLAELDDLKVTIVPKSLSITGATRSDNYFDCTIDVGVQRRVNVDNAAEIDALTDLVEEIADCLRMKRLSTLPDAAWLSIENEPVCAPEHLDQQRAFTSVITVMYRVRR